MFNPDILNISWSNDGLSFIGEYHGQDVWQGAHHRRDKYRSVHTMRNSFDTRKKPPIPRIPRVISASFDWLTQAASMKHMSLLHRGKYGDSKKPKAVPRNPSIIDQGPKAQTSENASVLGESLKGRGSKSA